MNKVTLIGRLAREIEVKKSGEVSYTNFSLAVARQKKDEADFINCTAFGKTAEVLGNWTKKGGRIAIEGRLQVDSYEKDGAKHSTTKVVVERVEILDFKDKADTQGNPFIENNGTTDEQLPF